MTQELNKYGLEAAAAEILMDLAFLQPKVPIVIAEKAVKAYLSHPKATGFESRVEMLFKDDTLKMHRWIVEAGILIREMQAALAGAGYE